MGYFQTILKDGIHAIISNKFKMEHLKMVNDSSGAKKAAAMTCEIVERRDHFLHIRLSGMLVDAIQFANLIGDVPEELRITCKDIQRINSVGTLSWMKYFENLSERKVKLVFSECSVAVIEQSGLISNFLCNGIIESMCVHFYCSSCKDDFTQCFKLSELKNFMISPPSPPCPKCSNEHTVIDDIPDWLFTIVSKV